MKVHDVSQRDSFTTLFRSLSSDPLAPKNMKRWPLHGDRPPWGVLRSAFRGRTRRWNFTPSRKDLHQAIGFWRSLREVPEKMATYVVPVFFMSHVLL